MLVPPSEMSLLANIVSIRRDIAYILSRPAEKARPKGAIYEYRSHTERICRRTARGRHFS